MVFSSVSFIFYFLPAVILAVYLLPKQRNLILLISSIFFYFYGEKMYVAILLFACLFNYAFARYLESHRSKRMLVLGVAVDLIALLYFKYTAFLLGLFNISVNIVLPIGISFFTFQGLSYLCDVYEGRVAAERRFIDFAAYLTMFPQLVAGPIVRYQDIAAELSVFKSSSDSFACGIRRFIVGLFKKLVIANTLGELAAILASLNEPTVVSYWLDAFFDALQIYFDFSAYSDMAIGMGLFFGFHFLENFNYPFIARSIREFWLRWHISLSTFFKDYVYIPLGGSKVKISRYIINMLIVWFLTGFWHGADWNFMLWGIYFAVLIIAEKLWLSRWLNDHRIFGHVYTFVLVVISFVIFTNPDLDRLLINFKGLLGLNVPLLNVETIYYCRNYLPFLLICLISATPLGHKLYERWQKKIGYAEIAVLMIMFMMAIGFLLDESFNPFLYFRF